MTTILVHYYLGRGSLELFRAAGEIAAAREWALVYDAAERRWEAWSAGEFRPGSVGASLDEAERLLRNQAIASHGPDVGFVYRLDFSTSSAPGWIMCWRVGSTSALAGSVLSTRKGLSSQVRPTPRFQPPTSRK